MLEMLLLSGFAGAMIPLGAWIANRFRGASGPNAATIRHFIVAFGAGALLAAVTLVLVPHGSEVLPPWATLTCLILGALLFARIDLWVSRAGGPRGQLVAMLSDFVPEAVALGALLALGGEGALLMALLIGLQNLPEGFNAFREATGDSDRPPQKVLAQFGALALIGPIAALGGALFLSGTPVTLGVLMVLAGGGILYLVFQDIAPNVPLSSTWVPPLGAVLGFALGLAGDLYLP